MRRVLVTGGAGFLGSYLCELLSRAGADVVCLDNLQTGTRESARRLQRAGVEFVHRDVVDPFACEVDEIFHLACPASPVHYQKDAVKTLETAFIGTRNMLELARETGARILIASTSEIYGDPAVHPQPEGYWGRVNPIGPRSCYDEGKRSGEALAAAYAARDGVDVRVVRIFNTYGPGMSAQDGRVISNFVMQALENRPLTVHGDGGQTRSFCYVADLIDGLLRLMATDEDPGPVNIGNPEETTVRELAELVLELTGSRSAIEHRPMPVDDPVRRRPDIGKAREVLGWEPQVNLMVGLPMVIDGFRERLIRPAVARTAQQQVS